MPTWFFCPGGFVCFYNGSISTFNRKSNHICRHGEMWVSWQKDLVSHVPPPVIFFSLSLLLLSMSHFINPERRLENKWIDTLLHNLLSALFASLLMNEQLKNRIILIGDIQRDIISSLSVAAAWVCQWLRYMVREWSLNVRSQPQSKCDRKSRKTVERNTQARQK